MTRLLVDVGNSRVKWAIAGAAPPYSVNAIAHHAGAPATIAALLADAGDVDDAAVVDVTGTLTDALAAHVRTRVLHSTAACCGVRNGYTEPATLGADRWAALIGARDAVRGACCIVDGGTALTFDALAADGTHLGGWIAPGVALARGALLQGTRGVRPAPGPHDVSQPAADTGAAVAGGVTLAALGFVERARRTAARALGGEPVLVVTGGDAALLAEHFPDALRIDDLVLRGLAVWAAS